MKREVAGAGRARARAKTRRRGHAGAPVLVEAQAPRGAVEEDALVRVLDVVLDDVVDPLVPRESALFVDERFHARAVVFARAAYHPLHARMPAKYPVAGFWILRGCVRMERAGVSCADGAGAWRLRC